MTFEQFVNSIVTFINQLIVPVIFALAFLTFIWGVFDLFFLSVGDVQKQSRARSFILYGLIGMAVLFSVWGLVSILLKTFGL